MTSSRLTPRIIRAWMSTDAKVTGRRENWRDWRFSANQITDRFWTTTPEIQEEREGGGSVVTFVQVSRTRANRLPLTHPVLQPRSKLINATNSTEARNPDPFHPFPRTPRPCTGIYARPIRHIAEKETEGRRRYPFVSSAQLIAPPKADDSHGAFVPRRRKLRASN